MQFNNLFHPMKYERDRPVTGNTNNSKDKGLFLFFYPSYCPLPLFSPPGGILSVGCTKELIMICPTIP